MVLEISVEFMKPAAPTGVAEQDGGPKRHKRRPLHDFYTVHVDSRRILTVSTAYELIAANWLTHVLRLTASNIKPLNPNPAFRHDAIFVGLIAETEDGVCYPPGKDHPYDLLTICIGSHCLMLRLHYQPPKLVKDFFDNPRVVVFGRDMANVAKKLKKLNMIEIRNAVDLNELAIRGMKRDDLDLGRYDLDRLAVTVLGTHYDVIRPEEKLKDWWTFDGDDSDFGMKGFRLCEEKVRISTLDAYLCLMIGAALVVTIHGARDSGAAENQKERVS